MKDDESQMGKDKDIPERRSEEVNMKMGVKRKDPEELND
jgi:hypothetical protein